LKEKKPKASSPNRKRGRQPLLDVLDAYPQRSEPHSKMARVGKEDQQDEIETMEQDEVNDEKRNNTKRRTTHEENSPLLHKKRNTNEEKQNTSVEDSMIEEEKKEQVSFNTSNISTSSLLGNSFSEGIVDNVKSKGGRLVISPSRYRSNKR
jgi:hypothetical protein